jgi:prolyl-tRNA synthetase
MPVAAHKNPAISKAVDDAAEELRNSGFRIKIDARDLRPGQKYWDWEIKGVPLRLEIGPRDVDNGNAFAARRTGGKESIPLDNIVESVREQLELVHNELANRSHAHHSDCIIRLDTMDQKIVDGHIYEVAFDGTDADAELLEKKTGLAILGDAMTEYTEDQTCLVSGNLTRRKQHLARMY